MNYYDGPVSQERAKELKREWLGLHTSKPKGEGFRWSQINWLMAQLADSCVKESVRLAETEGDLWERFGKAHDIIHGAWYSVAPTFAIAYRDDNEKGLEAKELEKIDKAKHLLWRRHDVKRAFLEGTGSAEYPAIAKNSLIEALADYLARPYLRHPFLDWIFLDMSISLEIASYGESLKQNWLPGKRDFMGIHVRYIRSQGNLRQMTKIDWNETFEIINNWFWLELGIPICAIWLSVHFNYMKLGYWLLGVYLLCNICFYSAKLIALFLRFVRRLRGVVEPRVRFFKLWDEMYEVWKLLEGPVVNPSNVREAMIVSRSKGAVWDSAAWSLIDRVISIDAAVWVIQATD